MERDEYSIQEASVRLGIPIQKLRRWEKQGILVARRTRGGHRRYARELIDNLVESLPSPVTDRHSDELAAIKRELKEKRRIIQLLAESESRYRDLVETSHDLIWATDAQGRFTYLNSASVEIFGIAPKELIGRCFFDYEARPSHISNRRFLSTLRKHGEVKNYLSHLVNVNGQDRWVGINARVSLDDSHRVVGIRGTARDITDQHLAAEQIEHLAKYDQLTDLPNRVSLQQEIETAIESGHYGALLLLDVDHFKYVNDNFGHRAGDQLITGVAGVLRETLREVPAQVYRLGGDEFAVHLPECLRAQAVEVAETVLDALRQYRFHPNGHRGISNLTASAGIALYPFHGGDIAGLLANVDIAMYQAKDHGRNRYVLYDQDSSSIRSTHRRVHWAKKLREVLDEDRLVLYSQPVVRLTDAEPVHHEILVRIREEDGKIIPPGQFIEIAESLGIIRDIDLAVTWKLLNHVKERGEKGRKVRYSINLSRVSISDQHWVRRFHRMLADSGVNPNQLVFEITETAAMSEVDVTLAFIRSLKDMGCRLALDDFGAGFSSFYYLKRFDVDYLKIDMGFVKGLTTDEGNRIFIKALCEVARGLSKQVVAEGVEVPEVRQALLEMGVQYGQGFLFRKPAPLEEHLLLPPERSARAGAR
ncbi:MAG: EAL domain-containing protein [Betaproteobacteria bacterium]|nr:EAL domain-containing protein [Betaproteobacteria bacterium]